LRRAAIQGSCDAILTFTASVVETKELITYLESFISEKRKQRFEEVLQNRTNHLCVVLENIFQAHNASAVLRSCDCFGVQHVHFIENKNSLRISDEVAMGSSTWLNIHRHRAAEDNTRKTLEELKKQGYHIVVTSPHKNGFTPATLPVDKKIALVFGTEQEGLTPDALQSADDFLTVPMFGFTESFNISVCAALCMYEITSRIRANVPDWHISEPERSEILLSWLKASIDHSDAIVDRYLNKKKV
jgi:tRNA (guanosine-2'-O-)-methyltransferase